MLFAAALDFESRIKVKMISSMMNIAEDDDLATPLVAKVPVEVNPSTPPKSRRRTRFPPESVLCPAVFVPDVEAGVRIIFVV